MPDRSDVDDLSWSNLPNREGWRTRLQSHQRRLYERLDDLLKEREA